MAGDFHIRYNALPTLRKFHKSDARVRAVLGPVGCLPAETEVMTPRGWVRIDEWSGQQIAQWRDNGKIAFIKPKRYISAPYEGDMLSFDLEGGGSMVVTPNHRIVYRPIRTSLWCTADALRLMVDTVMDGEVEIPSTMDGTVPRMKTKPGFVPCVDGRQYCFETDTGAFLVRQNGRVFVTGNSGKSSAMILGEPLLRGMRQSPGPDMVRRTRGVMIRNTYNELITTTMKTFREWWGTAICTYKSDKPLSAVVRFPMKDETLVEIEVLFLALDKPDDVGKVRSLELTWGYINEASEISDFAIMDALNERIGRYPKQWDDGHGGYTGGCDWSGIWLDSNAPDDEHWIFKKFEVEKPEGYEIFHQPPAVLLKEGSTPENPVWVPNKGQVPGIPPAENIEHLGKAGEGWKYYMNQIPGKDYERVRVMLQGEYGTVAYGRPVFPEYKDAVFYAPNHKDADGKPKDVTVMRGLPLLLGIDFGIRFCGFCFAQLSPMRQLRIIEDGLLTDVSTRDAANYLLAKLHNEYRGLKVMARGDPAGMQRSRTDGRYDIDIMNEMGIPTQPCVTNSIKERIEALKLFMRKLVDGEPGFMIGSKAQYIRKGMLGRYYFKKISTAGREAMYKAEPMKNEFSHPMDSAQYIAASLVMESELRSEAVQTYGSEFAAVSQPRAATAIDSAGIY